MTDHLVAYEYGTGQVWAYVRTRSSADIESVIPEVEVYSTPPVWISDGELRALRERAVYRSNDALDLILHRRPPAAYQDTELVIGR